MVYLQVTAFLPLVFRRCWLGLGKRIQCGKSPTLGGFGDRTELGIAMSRSGSRLLDEQWLQQFIEKRQLNNSTAST